MFDYNSYTEVLRTPDDNYPGILKRVFVKKNIIRIDYIDYHFLEVGEGEESFYFYYDNAENALNCLIEYLDVSTTFELKEINYNLRPEDFSENNETVEQIWVNFYRDLQLHQISFPKNFQFFVIKTIYSTAIFLKIINSDLSDNIATKK